MKLGFAPRGVGEKREKGEEKGKKGEGKEEGKGGKRKVNGEG